MVGLATSAGAVGRRVEIVPLRTGLPTNGGPVLDRLINGLAARVARGEPCAIVWDIDGTIVDTRKRMLAAIHAYGRTDVTLEQLCDTAPHTDDVVRDFGLDAQRFMKVWERVFWDASTFGTDRPIPEVVDRMRRAASLGIRNIVLTGRNVELRAASSIYLQRNSIPFTTLLCKERGQGTVAHKIEQLGRLAASGLHLGAFVTDAGREIAGIQAIRGASAIPCVIVAGRGRPIADGAGITAHVLTVALCLSAIADKRRA